jgi:hypothetical protein
MTVKGTLETITAVAMLAGLSVLGAQPALAAHPPGPACQDITWNADLLKAFPRAPAACQEVIVRNGKKFARFDAKVVSVAPEGVVVKFLNTAGDPGRAITLKPGPNASVEIDGKKVEFSSLKKDDKLTFLVPEKTVGVISDPDDTAQSTIVL